MHRYCKCHEPKTLLAMILKNSTARELGFTLIELMVTVSIAAILLMVAAPSFVSYQRNSEMSSITNTLLSAINAARGEAMKRNMYAGISPKDGSNWNSGWIVYIDRNIDHNFSTSDDEIVFEQSSPPSYIAIAGTGTANESPPYVSYNGSGYPRNTSGGFGALTISLTRNDVSAAESAEQTRRIIVAASGRTRSCKPSLDPATCKVSATE